MTNEIDLQEKYLTIIKKILAQHLPANTIVWLYGSRAKGTAKKFSDIDLAIDAKQPLPFDILSRLAFAFEESSLPYKVDINDMLTASDSFKKIIDEQKVLLLKI